MLKLWPNVTFDRLNKQNFQCLLVFLNFRSGKYFSNSLKHKEVQWLRNIWCIWRTIKKYTSSYFTILENTQWRDCDLIRSYEYQTVIRSLLNVKAKAFLTRLCTQKPTWIQFRDHFDRFLCTVYLAVGTFVRSWHTFLFNKTCFMQRATIQGTLLPLRYGQPRLMCRPMTLEITYR